MDSGRGTTEGIKACQYRLKRPRQIRPSARPIGTTRHRSDRFSRRATFIRKKNEMNKQRHAKVGRRHGTQKQRRRGKPRNKRGCFRVTEQVGCSSRVPPTQTLNLDADISSLLRREIFAGCFKKVAYFHYLGNSSGRRAGGVWGGGKDLRVNSTVPSWRPHSVLVLCHLDTD